jgi:uncharacterized protein YceH (UPF0502 family)
MNILLNDTEARVLGALMEKEVTTPDYYPLSLNALVNACNQRSNRDPVMNLDEDGARRALIGLDKQCLVRAVSGADSRVTKYEHRLQEVFNFDRHEAAIICELLLRGPQTPGELRSRADRMHHFDDLSIVNTTLQKLIRREPPLVKLLPRQPGTKEARYAHLLCGDVIVSEADTETVRVVPISPKPDESERVARLESEVASLRKDVEQLQQQFAEFRRQFE